MSVVATKSLVEESPESTSKNLGYCDTPDENTKGYFVQQIMYRIRDPKPSLDFYSRVWGMMLMKRIDFPAAKFSLFFLGYPEDAATVPADKSEKTTFLFNCKAALELTHNWGTESDPDFKGYHNGNSEPRGYGHLGITVPDVFRACQRFQKLGVPFVKRPDEGAMKGLAFIKDPDGYWIEIFDANSMSKLLCEQP